MQTSNILNTTKHNTLHPAEPQLCCFFMRQETEPGFERMRTLEDVSPIFAVRRAHFFMRQETESGFGRMRTLEDVSPVFAVRRAHFFMP